jgi:hypothetical protein
MLLPGDIYTLTVSQMVDEQSLDPIGSGLINADARLTASFTAVPDGGTSFILFAVGLELSFAAAIIGRRSPAGRRVANQLLWNHLACLEGFEPPTF